MGAHGAVNPAASQARMNSSNADDASRRAEAMADAGPLDSSEIAKRSGCAERYVREWLNSQAAAGYVAYDPAGGRFQLPEEQAFALADPAAEVLDLPGRRHHGPRLGLDDQQRAAGAAAERLGGRPDPAADARRAR